ncbi:MAG TPA: DUF2934 domain-containing protein [Verrucomicrobiae bacterium]|nr:DUF2934 domain-containing protein [Verrucomicrobiae bacterium]
MSDTSSTPTHEQISARAYDIFIERGRPEGRDLDHWLEAEAQLRASAQDGNGSKTTAAPGNGRSQASTRTPSRARK